MAATEWGTVEATTAGLEAEFGAAVDGTDGMAVFLVSEGERPVGIIQSYRIGDDPEYLDDRWMVGAPPDEVSMDYLIGEPDAVGRGLGSEMIRRFAAGLWERYPRAPSAIVAVLADNPASWRALEKAGFARIWSGPARSDYGTDEPTHIYRLPRPDAGRLTPAHRRPALFATTKGRKTTDKLSVYFERWYSGI